MRVLHVIDTSERGGGQTAVGHLLRGFHGSDVATELACRAGGPLVDTARQIGAPYHAIPFDKRYLPVRARALARTVTERQIDVMHSHGLLATYYCTLAQRMFGARVPLVYHQHGFHHHNHGALTRGPRIAAERWLASRAAAVIAVSTSDRARLLEAGYVTPSRLHVIHYGLPAQDLPADALVKAHQAIDAPDDTPVVGLVARLHPQKGVDTFLRAADIVRRQHKVVFAIVGVGELEKELRTLATSLGLNGEVRWISGDVPGVAAMQYFTTGVLSSRWEGLPLVLLEYMSTPLPIVSTDVEGCLDAVGPAEAELVPCDKPAVMAEAILRLLRDPALAGRRAAAAQARFHEGFTLDVMVRRVRALYKEVCQ